MAVLGDYISIKHGFAFKGEYISHVDNGVILVTPGNFAIGGGFQEKKCKYYDGEYSDQYVLHAGDLIVTMTDLSRQGDTLGYGALVPESKDRIYLHNQRIGLINVISPELDKGFLYWFLRTPFYHSTIVSTSSGSTVKHTSPARICDVPIILPSMEEQKKISAILFALERKIELNNKINDNLEQQMRTLYKNWFIDLVPFEGIAPDNWGQESIYSLAEIIYGAPFSSKQFNTEGNGKPIIRIRDLKNQQFATYTTEVHPKGYLLQPGDIVVGMDGEFRPYIWGNKEAWLNQRICVFKNKRPKGKAFLYYTIEPLLYAVEQTQVATTVIHIGKKDFDAFTVTLPDDNILNRFDNLTAPMIDQIVSHSLENKRLEELRDALLPKLMSGEIDVEDVKI